jgi:hypothetical protein
MYPPRPSEFVSRAPTTEAVMRFIKFMGQLLLAIVVGSMAVIGTIAAVSITIHASPVAQENIFFGGLIVLALCIGCGVVFGERS